MAQCTDRMDGMDRDQIRNAIEQGNTALGIEFGSTRIKAVLVDGKNKPIAQGSYDWENRFEEGKWVECAECDESRRSKAVCLTRRFEEAVGVLYTFSLKQGF